MTMPFSMTNFRRNRQKGLPDKHLPLFVNNTTIYQKKLSVLQESGANFCVWSERPLPRGNGASEKQKFSTKSSRLNTTLFLRNSVVFCT